MDRNIRRALYTALVAGGLMVVAASAAHAAEERLPDPATQAVTDTIDGSTAARGDLDAAADVREPEGGAEGVVGDIVGPKGILGSLAEGDVGGVLDGALGEDGLVDDLLGGLPPTEAPGPDEPGTDEPGIDEPGTDEPGTDPGTDGPGTGDPGTDPGPDGPGPDEPGPDGPGIDEPGIDEPGTDEPVENPGTDGPGTDDPGTGKPGTSKPGTSKPGTSGPAAGGDSGVGTDSPGTNPPGTGSTTVGSGHGHYGSERPAGVTLTNAYPADARTAGADGQEDANGPRADRELPGGGVDISWGDNGDVVPDAAYDGSILSGDGLTTGLTGTMPEPESEPADKAEVKPAVVPGDTNPFARTGHMFTGQLSLISLLLGLGIAVLRMRRR
jgi:hypothetical protein